MSLSPDALEFQQKVAKAPISGNIDNPEGGFDALVQVLCEILALNKIFTIKSIAYLQFDFNFRLWSVKIKLVGEIYQDV